MVQFELSTSILH